MTEFIIGQKVRIKPPGMYRGATGNITEIYTTDDDEPLYQVNIRCFWFFWYDVWIPESELEARP